MKTVSRVHKLMVAAAAAATALSLSSCAMPVAAPVAGVPGFVHSPYTWWPRVIDVQGATPGTVVECPYTHYPFVVSSYCGATYEHGYAAPVERYSQRYSK
jgi:hypothetical protein